VALITEGLSFCSLVRWGEVGIGPVSIPLFSVIPKPTSNHQTGKRLSRSAAVSLYQTNNTSEKGGIEEVLKPKNYAVGGSK